MHLYDYQSIWMALNQNAQVGRMDFFLLLLHVSLNNDLDKAWFFHIIKLVVRQVFRSTWHKIYAALFHFVMVVNVIESKRLNTLDSGVKRLLISHSIIQIQFSDGNFNIKLIIRQILLLLYYRNQKRRENIFSIITILNVAVKSMFFNFPTTGRPKTIPTVWQEQIMLNIDSVLSNFKQQ